MLVAVSINRCDSITISENDNVFFKFFCKDAVTLCLLNNLEGNIRSEYMHH